MENMKICMGKQSLCSYFFIYYFQDKCTNIHYQVLTQNVVNTNLQGFGEEAAVSHALASLLVFGSGNILKVASS